MFAFGRQEGFLGGADRCEGPGFVGMVNKGATTSSESIKGGHGFACVLKY